MNQANLFVVIIFTLIGGLLSLVGGALLLKFNKNLDRFARLSIPFAAGALLGAVFFDVLPEGLKVSDTETVLGGVLIGIIGFFILERITQWFHHHHDEDSHDHKKSPLLIVLSDTMHNALDGVVIASAFLISVPTGIIATLAVAAHEIPQEIGDFGVLLSKGLSKKRVLLANALSAIATTLAAVVTYLLGDAEKLPLGIILGLGSGFLLYVALSDLIPTIHTKKSKKGKLDINIVLLILGVLVVGIAVKLSHSYIEPDHAHESCVSYSDNEGAQILDKVCSDELVLMLK